MYISRTPFAFPVLPRLGVTHWLKVVRCSLCCETTTCPQPPPWSLCVRKRHGWKLDARFICVAYLLLTRSRTRLLALSVLASLPGLRSSTFYSVRHVRARVRVHLRRVTADNNNASKDETAARLAIGNARKASSAREDTRTQHEAAPDFHERDRSCLYCACAEAHNVIG